jgi:hypothetical protein
VALRENVPDRPSTLVGGRATRAHRFDLILKLARQLRDVHERLLEPSDGIDAAEVS